MMRTVTTEDDVAQLHMAQPSPISIETPVALRRWSERIRRGGSTVGLVPTMGALHAGHVSLIRAARRDCDHVVVSVFVNPTQFAVGEDLARYPRPLADDLELCRMEGVDAVFVPTVEAMYPAGATTSVTVGPPLATTLEGALRPGHFDGVATVVAKLFAAARPDRAYFGRKDAQQCAVVRRLVSDLDLGVEVVVCPLVRDCDGLALSSRNRYLTVAERDQALAIPAALALAARRFAAGERAAARLVAAARAELTSAPDLAVDYVAMVEPATFAPVRVARVRCEILIAARIGGTRLIDVLRLGVEEPPVVTRLRPRPKGEPPEPFGG